MFFFLSPSHIAAPPAKALTNHIASGVPFVAPAPITFMRPMLTRASVATRVNEQGLIEVVPADTPRVDHDPITLMPKGLPLEEERTNTLLQSSNMLSGLWSRFGTRIITSADFPIFASAEVFIVIGDGAFGAKNILRRFTVAETTKTFSMFCVEAQATLHNFYVGGISIYSPISIWQHGL